ncbi:beta-ketoacyl-[acyl-carrier-protein] synthase family protein [Desulfovibrio inopinatus]|uniref:beta-ketoacyl-[acyl-carrier-protein] synthase family protein n=1 Tax=Desulfovibrio inopinatus TaxID=102109 RepID=UPI0003F92ED8|nr:beta-ketoacyl-[acyl-carrier-protein] synthase family protein [Desulfovibrio inopinatus]
MPLRRVVITAAGAVSPFGAGVDSLWTALTNGQSAVSLRPELLDIQGLACKLGAIIPPEAGMNGRNIPRKTRRSMSPMSYYAVAACQEALNESDLDKDAITGGRLGLALSSTTGSGENMEAFFSEYLHSHDISSIKSMLLFRIMSHTLVTNAAMYFGIAGRILAPSAACASSLQAIGLGYETIAMGLQDMMLCGGAEEFSPMSVASFDVIQAASQAFNNSPTQTPRPFDRARDGIVCAEGAGVILLESLEHAVSRGAPILAEVLGFATMGDPDGMANPTDTALVRCMSQALEQAGLSASDIDYVNAHATGTILGDAAECRAVASLCGSEVPISSLKGHLGHTLAASGVLEMIASLLMIRENRIISTKNLSVIAEDCLGPMHIQSDVERSVCTVLKNSFALGGINASLVIGTTHL